MMQLGLELNISCQNTKLAADVLPTIKNQKAENNVSITFLDIEVNIHKEKASEVLTLNRNKIKGEFYGVFLNELFVSYLKSLSKILMKYSLAMKGKLLVVCFQLLHG
jgi:hypothetical protein